MKIEKERTEAIDAWLLAHKEEFVKDLAGFVRNPSVSVYQKGTYPFGKACADNLDYFIGKAKEYGLAAENLEYYAARARLAGTEGKTVIGIFGHGDVVPAVGEWEKDPFALWQKDDWLIGRGAGDNKGACLGALYALRYLKENGIVLKNHVDLYVGSAEETGSEDMVYLREHYPMPDFSLVPDAGFPVCYGEKGIISACAQESIYDSNLKDFKGGQAENIVAPTAEAVLTGLDFETVRKRLEEEERIEVYAADGGVRIVSNGIAQHSAFPEGSIDAIGQLARVLSEYGLVTGDAAVLVDFIGRSTKDYYGEGLDIACCDEISGKLTHVLTIIKVEEETLRIYYNIRYPVTADGAELVRKIKTKLSGAGFSTVNVADNPASRMMQDARTEALTEVPMPCWGRRKSPIQWRAALTRGNCRMRLPMALIIRRAGENRLFRQDREAPIRPMRRSA